MLRCLSSRTPSGWPGAKTAVCTFSAAVPSGPWKTSWSKSTRCQRPPFSSSGGGAQQHLLINCHNNGAHGSRSPASGGAERRQRRAVCPLEGPTALPQVRWQGGHGSQEHHLHLLHRHPGPALPLQPRQLLASCCSGCSIPLFIWAPTDSGPLGKCPLCPLNKAVLRAGNKVTDRPSPLAL